MAGGRTRARQFPTALFRGEFQKLACLTFTIREESLTKVKTIYTYPDPVLKQGGGLEI